MGILATAGRQAVLSENRFQLAPGLRVLAIREGAIVSSSKGLFRLHGLSAARFLGEILPALYGTDASEDELLRAIPSWADELRPVLEKADIVRVGEEIRWIGAPEPNRISVARSTPMTRRVVDWLVARGFKKGSPGDFVLADFSGLDAVASEDLASHLHLTARRSLAVWCGGAECLVGPVSEHGFNACWNCLRLRAADSLASVRRPQMPGELEMTEIIGDNVLLAIRYPAITAHGCVVIDNGQASTVHTIVPMPWCAICGGAASPMISPAAPLAAHGDVPPEYRVLADERAGILRQLTFYEGAGDEAPALPYCCTASIAPYQDEEISFPTRSGEGKGATREDSVRSAIGEGLERYAASLWRRSDLTRAPFRVVAERAFDPRWLVLYDETQYAQTGFPFAPFEESRSIYWTTGRWLDTGEVALLPAQAVYMNFPAPLSERFGQTTSSGLAAGASFEDAACRALYELIERDAFMLYWLSSMPGRRIERFGLDPIVSQAISEVELLGARIELYLLDAGTNHPTIVCVGLGDGQSWPGVTIGLAAHADPDIALRRAVLEHSHYGAYMRRLMLAGRHAFLHEPEQVSSALDHGLYYIDPPHTTALDQFRSARSSDAMTITELRERYRSPATLAACVEALRRAGIRAAAADVTSPDVALAPIRVVRAFGTLLQPIHFGFFNRRLRNPRLDRLLSGPAETNPHPLA